MTLTTAFTGSAVAQAWLPELRTTDASAPQPPPSPQCNRDVRERADALTAAALQQADDSVALLLTSRALEEARGGGCRNVATAEPTLRELLAKRHSRLLDRHDAKIDMSRPEQIHAMVKSAQEQLGGVDILVNNAGIQHTSPIETFPAERWDAILAINLSSAFHTIQAALPGMRASNWGRIINIASVHGLVASVDKSAYVAAKHGLVGLTKAVALETAKSGVTCNAICPGWVLTPLVQKQIDARAARDGLSQEQAKTALLSEKQPSGEFATPEQIGAICLFLCCCSGS